MRNPGAQILGLNELEEKEKLQVATTAFKQTGRCHFSCYRVSIMSCPKSRFLYNGFLLGRTSWTLGSRFFHGIKVFGAIQLFCFVLIHEEQLKQRSQRSTTSPLVLILDDNPEHTAHA